MKRREFITLLSGVAAGGTGAAAHDAGGSECGLLLLVYLLDAASVALFPGKRARQPGPHGLLGLVKLQKSPADRERIVLLCSRVEASMSVCSRAGP
jgi:hypothetical protein